MEMQQHTVDRAFDVARFEDHTGDLLERVVGNDA
jgi:hypothetical protein